LPRHSYAYEASISTGKEWEPETGTYYFGARRYDPTIGMWLGMDPVRQFWSPYTKTGGGLNPLNSIDLDGREDVLVIDQAERPPDDGTDEDTYTAEIYVRDNEGEMHGPYRGSSYPNSVNPTDNSTNANTANADETFLFNNAYGHSGGMQKGLNVVNEQGERIANGTRPNGQEIIMQYVNVHRGFSNNGNYNSRGSEGCITIHPDDWNNFIANFDWSNGNTGASSGHIFIFRTGQTPVDLPNYDQSGK